MSEREIKLIISDTIKDEFKKLILPSGNPPHFELLTRKESAAFLGISHPTMYKLIKQGLLTPRRLGTIIRFEKSDLEKAFGHVNNLKGKGSQGKKI